jgi:iron-sulfur cluster insertion protein
VIHELKASYQLLLKQVLCHYILRDIVTKKNERRMQGIEEHTRDTQSAAAISPDAVGFMVSDNAAARVAKLLKEEEDPVNSKLRVAVMGGGCSGFQYTFEFDTAPVAEDDLLIEKYGARVVIDSTSLDILQGSQLDYVETLGAAAFEITNPNATSSCGCGNSFSVV